MSTKTTIKRIALVAAVALTLGGFSAVPAFAGNNGVTESTAVTSAVAATPTAPAPQGTAITMNLNAAIATTPLASGDSLTATYVLTDPNGAAVKTGNFTTATNGTPTRAVFTQSSAATGYSSGQALTVTATGGTVATGTLTLGTLTFTPTMGGVYHLVSTTTGVIAAGNTLVVTQELDGTTSATTGAFYVKGINVSQGTTRGNPGAAASGNQAQVTVTLPAAASTTYKILSTGVGAIVGATPTDVTNANFSGVSSDFSQGLTATTSTTATNAHNEVLTLSSAAAGVQTISVSSIDANSGVATALYSTTVTWGAVAVLAPSLSTAYNNDPAGAVTASATTNAVARSAVKTAGTPIAQITVTLNKTDGTADTNGDKVSASISGSGFVLVDETNGVGTLASTTNRTSSSSVAQSVHYVHVATDGTAGVGTITVSVTDAVSLVTTTIGTFAVTSYGPAAALAVTANYTIGEIGGYTTGAAAVTRAKGNEALNPLDHTTVDPTSGIMGTTVPAFVVKVTDANGYLVNLTSGGSAIVPTVSSSDITVISSGTCVKDDGSSTTYSTGAGVGYYNCSFTTAPSSVSGGKAILTIKTPNPADTTGTTYLTTTLNVTVGGKVAKTVVAFDSPTYNAGDALNVTETATDSAGNPVYDGAASTALSSSKALGGDGLADFTGWYTAGTDSLAASVAKSHSYAPSLSGDFVITGTDSALNALSATATVTTVGDTEANAATDAANEATDAANAATDAANAAADAADAATSAAQDAGAKADAALAAVTALSAKITVLAAQIAKIVKKLKA